MSAAPSTLEPGGWATDLVWLGVWIVPSIVGHALVVAALALFSIVPSCQERDPAFEDVIEVSLVIMPKSDSKMATMDVRAPTPPAPQTPEASSAPEVAPPPPDAAPPPPVQSDLVIRDETTPDPKAATRPSTEPDPDRERREAERRDMLRRLAMQNLDAPVGATESRASDPDGTGDERIDLGGSGPIADPELARYVQRARELFMSKFNPLQTVAQQNPKIACQIRVRFDMDTGRVTSWEWIKRSGNPSWDGAAERAIEAVQSVPIPPDRHRGRFASGYVVIFDASSL